jgi:nucleotide-binding universal stress UspA family protein
MKTLDAQTRIELKNILFTTDFSPAAGAALPYAAELAKHYGAKLYALHVRTPVINPMTPPAGWPALEKAAEEEERERRETLRRAIPGIEPTVLIEDGDLWTNVQSVVEKQNIDLIVMGTRGRTGVGKFLLGSAAEEIFRDATCPVLTVGPHVPDEPRRGGEITRILYATNFNSGPLPAAEYALSLAQEYQAHLTLLHVIEEPKVGELVVPQDLMESSKRHLAKIVPPEAELWCVPDFVVERGSVAEKILEVAKNRKADLIVLGIHEASGFPGAASHLPMSTAHKIVSHAECPVLTVRAVENAAR